MKNKTKALMPALLLVFLIALAVQTAQAQTPDPSQRGPFATIAEEYNLGDTAFTPTGFPAAVEVRAVAFHPTDLTQGPFPLVLFLHGRHSTCFQGGSSFLEWPCAAGHSPILSFRGYDYAADVLASHGYFVISISANGINARDNSTADLGAGARAQLIQRHLDLWRQFNSTGGSPFGARFVGRVDLTRVGTMGHSRGGEGVLRHFLFNKTQPSPYPVKVVVPIAPTNFSRWQVNDGVAVAQLLSYCDGDVNNIQGVHAYDDARYQIFNSGYQEYVTVMGGNHNFYNSNWTPGNGVFPANDDWSATGDPFCGTVAGNGRLTATQQRAVAQAYLPAFFRSEVGGETAFKPLIDGTGGLPPSVSALNLKVSFHPADNQRRDLNRLLTAADLTTNFLGGTTSQTGLTPHDLCGGNSPQPQHCLTSQSTARQPHTAPSSISTLRGLSQLRTGWGALNAVFVNNIPAGPNRNISAFEFFQFRATVNFTDTRNPVGQAQDMSVRFTDENGASQSLRAGQFSNALFFPPGTTGAVPKVLHNMVRIPLSSLTAVDKTRITRVEFLFNQRATGALLVSDLHFYNTQPTVVQTLFADDFEADRGWVRNPSGTDTAATGLWERGNPEETNSNGIKQLGTTVSGVNDLVTARLAGASAGANDVDGGTTSIQSPLITLTGGTNFTLTFSFYFAHGTNSTNADFFRVSVISGATRTTVFQQLGAATNVNAAFATATVNLSSFAGQTIRILIETADAGTASLIEAAVDDVRITAQ